jgi:sigma-B regulation protein RsbU (phosphoserine phosphatase)
LVRAFAQQHYALRWMDGLDVEGLAGNGRPVLPSTGSSALKNAMELTNNYIANTHGNTSMFATLFFGVLDPGTGALLYASGGHEYPLLVNSNGVKERLDPTGPLVGLLPGTHFGIRSVQIEPGETLIAFTDGVTEARSLDGGLYGRERLYALLAQPVSSAAAMLANIQAELCAFSDGAGASDDVTLLVARRQ